MEDDQLEVDLFGDSGTIGDNVALDLPLQSLPVAGVAQHVDDTHRSSTERTRIAWSRQGSLATVSSDLRSVSLRHLQFSSSDQKWILSKEQSLDLGGSGEPLHPNLQLEWNQTGYDLAIADAAGRIAVVNLSPMAVNEVRIIRPFSSDREDELNQVLKIQWLNHTERQLQKFTFGSAIKNQAGRWTYRKVSQSPVGPSCHTGFATITRRGVLVVHFYRRFEGWTSTSADLKILTSTGCLLTHAAIASAELNKLLIVAQNSKKQLLVYYAHIEFPEPQKDRRSTAPVEITLEIIKAPVSCQDLGEEIAPHDGSMLFDSRSHILSHLEIIPPSEIESRNRQPPTIVASYTPALNVLGLVEDGQLAVSTIRRWQVVTLEPEIHTNFDLVQPKRPSNPLSSKRNLQRLEDTHIDQVITTVQRIDISEHLALGFADGSIAFYDSTSLNPVYALSNLSEIKSLSQTGFAFSAAPQGLCKAISSNGCALVTLSGDGKVHMTHLENLSGLAPNSSDPEATEATLTAIILTFARACVSQTPTTDISFLITEVLDQPLHARLIQGLLKDLLGDNEFLAPKESLSNPIWRFVVPRVFGLISAHEHDLQTGQRSTTAILSWLTLAVRSTAWIFIQIWRNVAQNGGSEWRDPDVGDIACQNIEWALDLYKSIVDDVFEMVDGENFSVKAAAKPTSSINITKLLLMFNSSRTWLIMMSNIFHSLVHKTQTQEISVSPAAAPTIDRMAKLIDQSSFKIEALAHLLSDVDKIVLKFYEGAGMSESQRADNERFILSHGEVPKAMEEKVILHLREVLPERRKNFDRLSLYLEDFSWLGIRDDKVTQAFRTDYVLDIWRKKILVRKSLGKVRKCVRCGAVSSDLAAQRLWPQSLSQMVVRCTCENLFAIVG